MKKIMIKENERGLLFKKCKFERILEPGEYFFWSNNADVKKVPLKEPLNCLSPDVDINVLLKNKNIAEQTDVCEVKDGQIGFHFVDGVFRHAILPNSNKYLYWNVEHENKFIVMDTSNPETAEDLPKYMFKANKIPCSYYREIIVQENEKAAVFYNGKFEKLLDPGTYYFWVCGGISVTYRIFDMRLLNISINGQEVLTRDKVTIRINLTVNYKIKDCIKMYNETENCSEQIHILAQLALRDFVGRYNLDEILMSKNEMSEFVLKRLKENQDKLYIEIMEAGVKDIILPGEIRDIMNTVLVAEKRAQANVITRREEVASTRSLLNTAKLMEENKTLYKLKELEYIERICENIESINIGGGDILTQLTKLIAKD